MLMLCRLPFLEETELNSWPPNSYSFIFSIWRSRQTVHQTYSFSFFFQNATLSSRALSLVRIFCCRADSCATVSLFLGVSASGASSFCSLPGPLSSANSRSNCWKQHTREQVKKKTLLRQSLHSDRHFFFFVVRCISQRRWSKWKCGWQVVEALWKSKGDFNLGASSSTEQTMVWKRRLGSLLTEIKHVKSVMDWVWTQP